MIADRHSNGGDIAVGIDRRSPNHRIINLNVLSLTEGDYLVVRRSHYVLMRFRIPNLSFGPQNKREMPIAFFYQYIWYTDRSRIVESTECEGSRARIS